MSRRIATGVVALSLLLVACTAGEPEPAPSTPEEPTTTITVKAEDADAMERGELDPMQAFMSGRILVAGDMALMMQMQAIQMQAQAAAQPKTG